MEDFGSGVFLQV